LREDYEKFIRIAQEELPDSATLELRGNASPSRYNLIPCKIRDLNSLIVEQGDGEKKYNRGLFLDVFPFDHFSKKNSLRYTYERFVKFAFISAGKLKESVDYKDDSLFRKICSMFTRLWLSLFQLTLKVARKEIDRSVENSERRPQLGFGYDVPFKACHPSSVVFPLKEICFEGYSFFCPNKTELFLKGSFGPDYMTPPPEHKRVVHALKIIPDLRMKA
ncbi:MAG: LicD family protein, partial [Bacteroidales bacterium]|nr:LicD family protein [Bacteroidales bacterium]